MKKGTWKQVLLMLAVLAVFSSLTVTVFATEGITPLDSVTLTSVTVYGDGPVVRWEAVTDAQVYQVFRKEAGGAWTQLATTGGLAYKDKTAASGATYSYTVLAKNGDRISPMDEGNSLSVYMGVGDVTTASAQAHVTGNIIRWEPATNAVFYQVLRLKSGETSWTLLKNTSGTAYKDETAEVGVKYYYKIRSRNGTLMSSLSVPSVSAIRQPADVTISSSTAHPSGNILYWNAVENARIYQVYRRGEGETGWTLVANTTGLGYKDAKAEYGVPYLYSIRAIVGQGVGRVGINTVSLSRPPSHQNLLTKVTLQIDGGSYVTYPGRYGFHIRWNAASGATEYRILRRTESTDWSVLTVLSAQLPRYYFDQDLEPDTVYYYTVQPMANETYGTYDKTGVRVEYAPFDKKAIAAVSEAMKTRFEMLENGETDMVLIAETEHSILLDILESSTKYYHDLDIRNSCVQYYNGVEKQRDALNESAYYATYERQAIFYAGVAECAEAAAALQEYGGYFTDEPVIMEQYVEVAGDYRAYADAIETLNGCLVNELILDAEAWDLSSDEKSLISTFTNNTDYYFTADFFIYFYSGDTVIDIVTISPDTIAPGQTYTLQARIPSGNVDSFGIDFGYTMTHDEPF